MRNRSIRWVIAFIAMCVLGAAACGGGDDDDDAGSGSDNGSSSSNNGGSSGSDDGGGSDGGGGASSEFDPDGVLRVGVNLVSSQWTDPNDDAGLPSPPGWWMNLIHGRMLRHGETVGDIEPGMITEWSTPDDNTVELTLVEGAMFSDGTPFNAEAVKFSWERCLASEGFILDLFGALESIDVVDDHNLVVHLNRPFAGVWVEFLLTGPAYCISVVSPAAVEQWGDEYAQNPVGAGPYMMESHETDQRIVLVPNPHYHNPADQTFARIEFVQVASGAPMVTALASGQVDLGAVTVADLAALDGAGVSYVMRPGSTNTHLEVCQNKFPLDTVDARRAVLHALDVEEINTAVFHGHNIEARQIMPPNYPYWSGVGADENVFDLDRARELAQSSGLAGQTIDLQFFASNPVQGTMAELVAAQLAEIDVTVNIVPSQNPFADKNANQPHLSIWGYFPQSINTTLAPGQINNACGFDEPSVNAALDSLWRADKSAVQQANDDLQTAVNELVAILPLSLNMVAMGHSDRVIGEIVLPENGFHGLDWEKIGIQP